jgi:hypothetical protein
MEVSMAAVTVREGDTAREVAGEPFVQFNKAQLQYIKKLFPTTVQYPTATPADMYWYNGTQAVVDAIERRTVK